MGMDYEYVWHNISAHEDIESADLMKKDYPKSLIGQINNFIDYEVKEMEIN